MAGRSASVKKESALKKYRCDGFALRAIAGRCGRMPIAMKSTDPKGT